MRHTAPAASNPAAAASPRGAARPSITDVARLAGVSYQTVSRVINQSPDVSSETRARVLAVIEQVGYRRNKTATALVTARSTVIGILTDDSPRYGPVRTLLALETAARHSGYGSTVVTVTEPYEQSVQQALHFLEDSGVDGIIAIAPRLSMATAIRKASFGVPVEMIAAGASSTPGVFTYSENQELGARLATEHLIALGHKTIAHVAGSMEWFDGRVRKRGWESALRAAGLPRGPYFEGDWSPGWAYETGLRFLREGLPDAIFAASDHTALGLFRAFYENGVNVPGDVSVVGFDDIEGSDFFFPPLTTVRQDFDALARGSIDLILGSIDGRDVDRTPIPPTLVVRDSTAPAPASSRTRRLAGKAAVAPQRARAARRRSTRRAADTES